MNETKQNKQGIIVIIGVVILMTFSVYGIYSLISNPYEKGFEDGRDSLVFDYERGYKDCLSNTKNNPCNKLDNCRLVEGETEGEYYLYWSVEELNKSEVR